jgi:hypothetical protein
LWFIVEETRKNRRGLCPLDLSKINNGLESKLSKDYGSSGFGVYFFSGVVNFLRIAVFT